jgi:hypothetical protein
MKTLDQFTDPVVSEEEFLRAFRNLGQLRSPYFSNTSFSFNPEEVYRTCNESLDEAARDFIAKLDEKK